VNVRALLNPLFCAIPWPRDQGQVNVALPLTMPEVPGKPVRLPVERMDSAAAALERLGRYT
jgi:hypothetical protein